MSIGFKPKKIEVKGNIKKTRKFTPPKTIGTKKERTYKMLWKPPKKQRTKRINPPTNLKEIKSEITKTKISLTAKRETENIKKLTRNALPNFSSVDHKKFLSNWNLKNLR